MIADPDSDTPRPVYADALQAAGDPRGEFIALQCELARLGCDHTRCASWIAEVRNTRVGECGAELLRRAYPQLQVDT